MAKHQWVQLFGRHFAGETGVFYIVDYGRVMFDYSRGWAGANPRRDWLCNLPGLAVYRDFVTFPRVKRGETRLIIEMRLVEFCSRKHPSSSAGPRIALPMLRRRVR